MFRRDIFSELRRLHNEFNSMFRSFFDDTNLLGFDDSANTVPMISSDSARSLDYRNDFGNNYRNALFDMVETETKYLVDVELPGVDKKDIQVNVDDNSLEIKVAKKNSVEKKSSKDNVYMRKSFFGFYRRISMPEDADPSKIEAEYKNGVLRLEIQKTKSSKKKKQIQIR